MTSAEPFLVIFDVDGTLVDSADTIVEAQRRTFAALALPAPTRARSLSVVGLSLPEAFAALVGAGAPVDALVDGYKRAWLDMRREPGFAEPLFPGAAETLALLATLPGVRLGLATGKSRRGVDRLLTTYGLHDLFATTQTADEHPSKPHPSMLLRALADTGVSTARASYVGDTTFDMAAARAAAIAAIGVGWGHHPAEDLRSAGATAVARDFADLRHLLLRRLASSPEGDRQAALVPPRNPVANT